MDRILEILQRNECTAAWHLDILGLNRTEAKRKLVSTSTSLSLSVCVCLWVAPEVRLINLLSFLLWTWQVWLLCARNAIQLNGGVSTSKPSPYLVISFLLLGMFSGMCVIYSLGWNYRSLVKWSAPKHNYKDQLVTNWSLLYTFKGAHIQIADKLATSNHSTPCLLTHMEFEGPPPFHFDESCTWVSFVLHVRITQLIFQAKKRK
jgi:hypothetical protein